MVISKPDIDEEKRYSNLLCPTLIPIRDSAIGLSSVRVLPHR
nr:MAG TPA: hypothetical protein [Caudoviricetes sp.]